MTSPDTKNTANHPGDPTRTDAQPVGERLRHEAIGLLIGNAATVPAEAVEQFIRQAPDLGIDLDLMAAVIETGPGQAKTVKQVCLPVIGEGRTVMLFVSAGGTDTTSPNQQRTHRAQAILRAIELAQDRHGDRIHLIQGLLEPKETWAAEAFQAAGLRRLSELVYLSRPLSLGESNRSTPDTARIDPPEGESWPEGITVRSMDPEPADEDALEQALDASYQETLDCPELAGMRTTEDIIDAHRAVGGHNPRLWWLIEQAGRVEGCVLLNRCAAQGCVELVYIGLSPALRGLGLGQLLMRSAIGACARLERELRCAVDLRNQPARRLYARLGFREAGRRVAYVGLVKDLLSRNHPTP